MEIIFTIALVALAALNVYASLRCYRNIFSSQGQRLAQIAFIWIVPFFGATLALHLLRDQPEKGAGVYPPETSLGDEYASGRQNSQGYLTPVTGDLHSANSVDTSPD